MKTYPYKSYVFRTTDPVLDAIQPILRTVNRKEFKKVCNVSDTTLSNWKKKKTRRPQFATISEVALAAGCYGISFVDGVPVFQMDPMQKKLKVVK